MKILSTADLHYSPSNREAFFKSASFFLHKAREEKPDLITFAGDLLHHSIHNSGSAGFPELVEWVRELLDIAPIVTIYGTSSHDVPGSLDVFAQIQAGHRFTILQPGTGYILTGDGNGVLSIPPGETSAKWSEDDQLLILGIPEPSKSWLLANKNLGSGQATEAIKEAMMSHLIGLAALRKEHADIPCIVLYHGEIVGASLGSQKLPAGGISIGWRDLAMIGADYYSLGHIHEPQQFGELPAYYEGSIYPVSWNELTQKRFHEVTFTHEGDHIEGKVYEHNYPHPPRKKKTISVVTNKNTPGWATELEGFQAWVEVEGSKQDLATFNPEHTLKKLISEYGALPGSRVTTRVTREETTRAAEIVGKTALFDKVKVYADNTALAIPDGTEKRCDELEAEIRKQGFDHTPRKLRLDRLDLRGAIGVWKGIGKEEIVIDFAALDAGTIALIGDNGSGKSTVVQQCNPYPDPIDGGRKQQDNFFLRDSWSITY